MSHILVSCLGASCMCEKAQGQRSNTGHRRAVAAPMSPASTFAFLYLRYGDLASVPNYSKWSHSVDFIWLTHTPRASPFRINFSQ